MKRQFGHMTILVDDYDKAIQFYIDKLGFVKLMDNQMGPDMRWVSVAPSKDCETKIAIYRYADALLLLAECLVAENKAGEALPYLNQVRKRAGLPDLALATADNVSNERRHELAFENHRWLDLIRTGKAIEILNAKGVRLKAKYGWIIPAAFDVTEQKLLYPIPFREIQINNKLVQNPGY